MIQKVYHDAKTDRTIRVSAYSRNEQAAEHELSEVALNLVKKFNRGFINSFDLVNGLNDELRVIMEMRCVDQNGHDIYD